jgi:hypothetical protein
MKFELIQSNMSSPLLVYDGGPPKKIIYKVKNKKGKVECKLDLGEISMNSLPKSIPTDELDEIDNLIKFPRKRLIEEEEIVAPIEDGPIYFGSGFNKNKDCEYIVCFTLFEKQPGRYQCFVLAVLQRK